MFGSLYLGFGNQRQSLAAKARQGFRLALEEVQLLMAGKPCLASGNPCRALSASSRLPLQTAPKVPRTSSLGSSTALLQDLSRQADLQKPRQELNLSRQGHSLKANDRHNRLAPKHGSNTLPAEYLAEAFHSPTNRTAIATPDEERRASHAHAGPSHAPIPRSGRSSPILQPLAPGRQHSAEGPQTLPSCPVNTSSDRGVGISSTNQQQQQPEAPPGHAEKLPAGVCSLSGTVERVLFQSNEGFFILRVRPFKVDGCSPPAQTPSRPKGPPFKRPRDSSLFTVSGNMGQIHPLSQKIQFEGKWQQHAKHGLQLVCTKVQLLQNDPASRALAEIISQISGVGKHTAELLGKAFGEHVTQVFDSPDAAQRLSKVKGIGPRSAAKFKASWDAQRGTRMAARELAEVGVPNRLAWQVVEEHGTNALGALTQDPYTTLRPLRGYSFRGTEAIAEQLGCSPQLPSRAWAAFTSVLQEAAHVDSHSYLPWSRLRQKTLQLLSTNGRSWESPQGLQRAAEQMALNQQMVIEHGPRVAPPRPSSSVTVAQPSSLASTVRQPLSDAHAANGSGVEAMLVQRIKGVGPHKARAMISKFGDEIVAVLDAPDAPQHLVKVAGIGPVFAARFKASWDAHASIADSPSARQEPMDAQPLSDLDVTRSSDRHPLGYQQTDQADHSTWADSSRCYLPDLHAAECKVTSCLVRMAASPRQQIIGGEERIVKWLGKLEQEEGITLTAAQKQAVVLAGSSPILVLTGGPGCGKTFTTRIIYKLWRRMSKTVALCAPTGRAAQRMTEWTGSPAKTIHRLLGFKSNGYEPLSAAGEQEDLSALQFKSNASQPLNPDTCNAMLVDEVSMLDLPLAAALMSAISPRSFFQLVLVGDVDQLPPVGPGDLLHSAIQSGAVPVVDLREIFRQAKRSSITTSAHAVNSGHFPDLLCLNPSTFPPPVQGKPLAEVVGSDALWICGKDGSLQQQVLQTLFGLLKPHGIDLVNDTQVMSPVRQGPASTSSLNAALQQQLNPAGPQSQEMSKKAWGNGIPQILRTGDKVLQRANNYDKDVYNGDIGFVNTVDTTGQELTVRFAAPSNQGPRFVTYSARELDELELAWATTVHKAQGGEVPIVVVALSTQYGPILSRRLLYTALTRASKMAVVVGSEQALQMAIHGWRKDVRLSTLLPRLQAASTGRAIATASARAPSLQTHAGSWQESAAVLAESRPEELASPAAAAKGISWPHEQGAQKRSSRVNRQLAYA